MLCLACAGNRFPSGPLAIGSCPDWDELLEQAGGTDRIVGCSEDSLALLGTDAPAAVEARWTEALVGTGLQVRRRTARPPAGIESADQAGLVYGEPDHDTLTLAVSARAGLTHTSLVRLP